MWECKFDVKSYKQLETPFMPQIMKLSETKNLNRLTEMIVNEEIFGFVSCSLQTTAHIIRKYKHLNFLPIIRKAVITEDMLSDYQKERV